MGYQFVHFVVEDHIAILTMDRPPVNAVNRQMYHELIAVLKELPDRNDVSVIVLTGAGDKAFCAGNDIQEFTQQDPSGIDAHVALMSLFFQTMYGCPVPIVGAVNGHALGTGCGIACFCDVLVTTPKATFGYPEIRVGAFGGGPKLRRLFPEHKARWLFLSGERVPAEELYRLGSVERLVPAEEVLPAALQLAQVLAGAPPLAIRAGKTSLNRGEYLDLWEASAIDEEYARQLRRTEDSAEAARAFLEKRPPRYKGR